MKIKITIENDIFGSRTEECTTKKQLNRIFASWYNHALDSDPGQSGHEKFTAECDGDILMQEYSY